MITNINKSYSYEKHRIKSIKSNHIYISSRYGVRVTIIVIRVASNGNYMYGSTIGIGISINISDSDTIYDKYVEGLK